jgi:hypothetical protein
LSFSPCLVFQIDIEVVFQFLDAVLNGLDLLWHFFAIILTVILLQNRSNITGVDESAVVGTPTTVRFTVRKSIPCSTAVLEQVRSLNEISGLD